MFCNWCSIEMNAWWEERQSLFRLWTWASNFCLDSIGMSGAERKDCEGTVARRERDRSPNVPFIAQTCRKWSLAVMGELIGAEGVWNETLWRIDTTMQHHATFLLQNCLTWHSVATMYQVSFIHAKVGYIFRVHSKRFDWGRSQCDRFNSIQAVTCGDH